MSLPTLEQIAKRICCPKRKDRADCAKSPGSCGAMELYFASASAVRDLIQNPEVKDPTE